MNQEQAKVAGKADAAMLARIRLEERRKKAKRMRARWRTTLGESIQQKRGENR